MSHWSINMLHLFLIGNQGPHDFHRDVPAYLKPYGTIIDPKEYENNAKFINLVPTDLFERTYYRIENDNTDHDGKVYIVVNLDFTKYTAEGYVEGWVFPALINDLKSIADGLGLQFKDKVQVDSSALYTYEGDTVVISSVVGNLFRKRVLRPVR